MPGTQISAAKLWARELQSAQQKAENEGMLIPAAVNFAIRWAVAIEMLVDKKSEIREIADATCEKANTGNLSGALYEYAIFFLRRNWVFGESLNPKLLPKKYDNLLLDIGVPIF
ncbi:MAG: hypothetical protein WC120_02040 [Parcubacteria group bacterium]